MTTTNDKTAIADVVKSGKAGGAIRISMPASIANDLDAFKKGVLAVAERLGCPECFSGFDCTFESERDFVINEKFKVASSAADVGNGFSRGAGTRQASVPVPPAREYDIGWILERIDILGRNLGSHWEQGGGALCCSGFDVTFGREVEFLLDGADNRLLPVR